MKILHTIHACGSYDAVQQSVHDTHHTDVLDFYQDYNQLDNKDVDPFTVVNEHGVFTSAPDVVESYVIIS